MKPLARKKFNGVFMLAMLFAIMSSAQTQSKRYSEKFNVNNDVEIQVNTAYSDLVFESWNRDQVEIEAVIEIEGISAEEAEKLFEKWNFNASGNSSKVTVSTGSPFMPGGRDAVTIAPADPSFYFDFPFEVEVPDVDVIVEALPENFVMPPMPPMPPVPADMHEFNFDYEAYKKEGEAYLKEWKKEFEQNFDEKYMKSYEAWGKEMEKRYEERAKEKQELEKDRGKLEEERQKMMEDRQKMIEEIRKEAEKNRAETRIMMEKVREEARRANREAREVMRNQAFTIKPGSDATLFLFEKDGMPKNLKIKKTIKIKAPKGARLNLNVRHGEIKLAENYRNINATLAYSRLHAPLVDGKNSEITASYSPMRVDYWKEGTLNASYVKDLELQRVQNIRLQSKSSNVTVQQLEGNAIINGSFGDLYIGKLNDSFDALDIVLENSDAILVLPEVSFDIYARTTHSRISAPNNLKLNVNEMQNSKQLKGYNKAKGSGRTIHIIANYSNLDLQGI